MIKSDLEIALEILPDEVAKAKAQWQIASLNKDEFEAKLYTKFKYEDPDRSATEIKALTHQDPERREMVLQEIAFEQQFNAKYESLMALKLSARLRAAF